MNHLGVFHYQYENLGLINKSASVFIDKIELSISAEYVTVTRTIQDIHGCLEIASFGDTRLFIIQGEFISPVCPFLSICSVLHLASCYGAFTPSMCVWLQNAFHSYCNGIISLEYLVYILLIQGPFKLKEFEIAYDFYGENIPFTLSSPSVFRCYQGTAYSRDYKPIVRNRRRSDGTQYSEVKEVIRSLVCIYDRGKKVGSDMKITRIEFRLSNRRARMIINPYYLLYTLEGIVISIGCRVQSIAKKYIPPGTLIFPDSFVDNTVPLLRNMIIL